MDFERIEKRSALRGKAIKGATYVGLTFWAILVLFPFYWMVLTSVKSYGSYNAEWIPQLYTLSPTLENYLEAFSAVPLADYFLIRQSGQVGVGQGVYRHLVSLVGFANLFGVDFVVGDPLAFPNQHTGMPQKLGIQVEGGFQTITVQKLDQADILGDTVVVAEGDGLFILGFPGSFHGGASLSIEFLLL